MEPPPEPDPEAELQNALAAIEEERTRGRIERRCLRDGGRLIFEDLGSGYVLRCENSDFRMTGRGI
jgi:hypothetical protein